MVWWVETKKSNSRQDKNFNFSKFSRQDISRICQTNSRQGKTLIGWKFQDKTRQDSHSCQEIIKTSRQEISRPTPGYNSHCAKRIYLKGLYTLFQVWNIMHKRAWQIHVKIDYDLKRHSWIMCYQMKLLLKIIKSNLLVL